MAPKSDITLYFLQASRSIRIAWLLEELKLPYESIFFPRENSECVLSSSRPRFSLIFFGIKMREMMMK